jgi:nitrile hydratase subunit beta
MSVQSALPLRFQVGDTVQVDDRDAIGHCRAPLFIRGRTGKVVTIHGTYHDPERLAYHLPGLPAQALYKVRFKQTSLWPDYAGSEQDQLEIDVYDNWLNAVDAP